jgi:3-methyladenine DNA glycosylase AlkD
MSVTVPPPDRAGVATAAAIAFVDAHRPAAVVLGGRLGELLDDPESFGVALDTGLAALADPVYAQAMPRVAPGLRGVAGVRQPLISAVETGVLRAARGTGPARLLAVADRASRSEVAEARWIATRLMDRIVAVDPERTWQLMRRAARTASEWISVDTLASPYARGVLLEPYRWAEVEQVVFSPSRWERRLAGSTIARMPFVDRTRGRRPEVAVRGLDVVGSLIGDSSPDVQKALSWALRSLILVDPRAVTRFCREEAERAAASDDGARAWVVRDALAKLEPGDAAAVRERIAGIRRRPGTTSTSAAAEMAARFGELPPPDSHPMAPFP